LSPAGRGIGKIQLSLFDQRAACAWTTAYSSPTFPDSGSWGRARGSAKFHRSCFQVIYSSCIPKRRKCMNLYEVTVGILQKSRLLLPASSLSHRP
jgi:hypothetical protein